jgi:two-component system NarL family sensor kinase
MSPIAPETADHLGIEPGRDSPERNRNTRWSVSAWIAAAVAILAVLVTAAEFWLWIVTPGDGVSMQSPGGVPWSRGRPVIVSGVVMPSEVHIGDEVLTVNGRDIHEWTRDLVVRPPSARPWRSGETVVYRIRRDGAVHQILVPVHGWTVWRWTEIGARIVALVVAALVFIRRPGAAPAHALLLFAAGYALNLVPSAVTLQIHDQFGPLSAIPYALSVIGYLLWTAAALHAALVFPRPFRLTNRSWLVGAVYGLPLGLFVMYLWSVRDGESTTGIRLAMFQGVVHLVRYGYPLVTVFVIGLRWRTERDPVARGQIRWVGITLAAAMLLEIGLFVLPWQLFGQSLLPAAFQPILLLCCLVGVIVAVMRYHAFDIEALVNRVLVWGTLTACVIAIYGGALVMLGLVLERQQRPRLLLIMVATGMIALGLQPLRTRLQRAVNRWMYGQRDDPAAVLAQLAHQLETAISVDKVLDHLVTTVAQTMKLPYVAIELPGPNGPELAASSGRPTAPLIGLPLAHDDTKGRLLVSSWAQSGALRPKDRALLQVLADRAAAAVNAAQLAAELERSRSDLEAAHSRLVETREEERRRLHRDLHDGIGPMLAGMTMQVDAARTLLRQDWTGSDTLMGKVREELELAVTEIRRLVKDLQSTPLDQLGLLPALREAAATFSSATGRAPVENGLHVTVEAAQDLTKLPAAVELAIYRIATEALTNTARHAHARHCWIRLTRDHDINLDVTDDGCGEKPEPCGAHGVGLASMAERATELGGAFRIEFHAGTGTHVHAQIPIAEA